MEELKIKVNEIENRVRMLEMDNSRQIATMEHLSSTLDRFTNALEKREEKDSERFEKFENSLSSLTKYFYISLGGLLLLQFLISSKIIQVG